MTTVLCPHCGAENAAGAAFCETCGKAMPSAVRSGPRVVTGDQVAATSAGLKLQSDALHKESKKAAGALLAVAIIQTVLGLIGFFAFRAAGDRMGDLPIDPTILVVSVLVVAAIFWGLYFWARRNPLPAAIVGLVIYVTLSVLDFIQLAQLREEAEAAGGRAPRVNIPWVKIIIIIILVQAISAGVRHRKLMQQAGRTPPAPGV